ncbi:MAG: TRAP transporter substrate-binding protein [Chloroflexi bacterium]|nr:TRAP transporter substrate-binding protein [Chloroflexota bacterium]
MKSRKLYLVLGLILVSALLSGVFGCQAPATPAPATSPAAKPAAPAPTAAPAATKLRLQTGYGQTHPISKSATWWAEQLQKKTNGKVNVEIFYGTPLGAANTQLEMVLGGTVDIAYFSFPWKTGVYPLNEIFYVPLPISKAETVARIHYALYQKGYLTKELSAVKVAWFADGPPGVFSARKPIRAMEDFKALKVRGTGIQAEMIKRLGGTPIDIPSAEAYQALEKGVADALFLNMASQYSMKLYEILKYVTPFEASTAFSSMYAMNPDVFKKLPSDVQAAIDSLIEGASVYEAQLYDQDTATGYDAFKKAGAEFVTLSAAENKRWSDVLLPITDKYVSDLEAKGIPAKKVIEEIKALAAQLEPKK